MKIWFFARTTDQEYLYLKVSNNAAKEVGLSITDINKLQILKVKASLFNDFYKNSSFNIYHAKVKIKGTKYYFFETHEIILKESAFFTKDELKKLPLVDSNLNKTDIIKTCYTKTRDEY